MKVNVYYDSTRSCVTYELVKDGVVINSSEPFSFTNLVLDEEPAAPSSPATGDEGITQWVMLMSVGIAGFAVTRIALIKRRRRA